MFGYWQWFSDARQLAGYLHHAGLPGMLSIWFCQQQWDMRYGDRPLGSREILAGALEHGYLVEDVPYVEGLLDRLEDPAVGGTGQTLEAVEEVTRAFTERFGRTRTWNLVLRVATSAEGAGTAIAKRLGWDEAYGPEELDEPFDLEHWLDLCRAADYGDPVATAVVAEVLANNDAL